MADVVAIIPARYASTRLPGKPLADIAGRPMIQHVYERAARAPGVARALVATDDERIANAVRAFGGDLVMTGTHATGTDRLAEVARGLDADVLVNVQGDLPLLDPDTIAACVAVFQDDAALEERAERGGSEPLAERGDDPAGDEDELGFGLLRGHR